MQADFHYYCIGVLARAAGFKAADALTIAYASQYVDDSTEAEPIRVGDLLFDPVRTAHIGLKVFDWSVQKRVYIPFHFIAPKAMKSDDTTFTFVTTPNSPLAQSVFKEATSEKDRLRRLCRIGVALHALADTWSHQGFSGIDEQANDVEAIYLLKNGKWEHLKLQNVILDFAPLVGHAQAGCYPDQAFLTWKYNNDLTGETIRRDNTSEFIAAAKRIWGLLLALNKPVPTSRDSKAFDELEPMIRELFENPEEDEDKRCDMWRGRFKDRFEGLPFKYSRYEWREEALQPEKRTDVFWDKLGQRQFNRLSFKLQPGFYNSRWVHFHAAAMMQRHFVLERLP